MITPTAILIACVCITDSCVERRGQCLSEEEKCEQICDAPPPPPQLQPVVKE